MKRTIPLWQALIALVLAILIAVLASFWLSGRFGALWSVVEKLQEVEELVQRHYLDADQLEIERLQDGASAGMLVGIGDPYAAYYSADDYVMKKQADDGHLVGIGVEVYPNADGSITIFRVYPTSPAAAAGLQAEDRIVQVDAQPLAGMGYAEVVALIRGEADTEVTLEVKREEKSFVVKTKRADVKLPSVSFEMLEEIAYVTIHDFNEETAPRFHEVLEELQQKGATGIVFDLRDNGGGLMTAVNAMLDELLPAGVLVTKTIASGTEEVLARSDEAGIDLPMVCLINGETASAAELFVAVLRDFDYAQSVGEKTYGKGVMQTSYALSDGSAVKFTTAYFAPPSGENFNDKGLEPDVGLALSEAEKEAFEKGNPEKDSQLAKAITLLS